MLTQNTKIACPDDIRGGYSPWSGTLREAFTLDEGLWTKLGELLAVHAPLDEDEDDDRSLNEAFEALSHLNDLELVRDLLDDPNAVILADDAPDFLVQIEEGQKTVTEAEESLRETIRQARDAGVPITSIAEAAGVTRQTIYAWLNEEGAAKRLNVSDMIDEGLRIVAIHAPQSQAGTRIGRNGSVLGKIAALRTGSKNVRMYDLSKSEREILSLALTVAGNAEAAQKRTGAYPRTVSKPIQYVRVHN